MAQVSDGRDICSVVEDIRGGLRELGAYTSFILIAVSHSTRFPFHPRTGHCGGTCMASEDPHVAGTQMWRSFSLAKFSNFFDLDDSVGRAGSVVPHMALLACKCLHIMHSNFFFETPHSS